MLRAALSFSIFCAVGLGQAGQTSKKGLLAGAAPMSPALSIQAKSSGAFALRDGVLLVAAKELAEHAEVLREELQILAGITATVVDTAPEDVPAIVLRIDEAWSAARDAAGLASEKFRLDVEPQRIVATAGSVVGIGWATSALLQCLPLRGVDGKHDRAMRVRSLVAADEPVAPYRSVMIDVARNPHSLDVLRGVVRACRLYRIRFLQLHLTDDQHFTFPFAPVTDKLKGNHSYDRERLLEFVRYADARGVTVIPEIDLPGHSARLRESKFLAGVESDRDVAGEAWWPTLRVLLDDVLDVFESSPFFHIGGDESGAGSALVPFLARVNKLVRSRGKRLIVWEGFHGRPTQALPARGEDRILVAAWESSYNPPWNLLDGGYELINASWRPLYVVGGGSRIHPGSTSGRNWSPLELASWHKDLFQHWEPGRPVYEDRGPGDDVLGDHRWEVPKAQRHRVLGGQVSVWEQRESSLLRSLRRRLPVVADRLWSGPTGESSAALLARIDAVDARVWGLVQPVELLPLSVRNDESARQLRDVATFYRGERTSVSMRNRTRVDGAVRFQMQAFSGSWSWIDWPVPAAPIDGSECAPGGIVPLVADGAAVRAALFAADGTQVGAESWLRCINWPMRVDVTEMDLPPAADLASLPMGHVPDIDALVAKRGDDAVTLRYRLPMLRGPLQHTGIKLQRLEASFLAPRDGVFEIGVKSQSGHASLWLDLNGDDGFDATEKLIANTPNTEERVVHPVTLKQGKRYRLRVDHRTGLPRPVLVVTLDRPGTKRPRDISKWLELLPGEEVPSGTESSKGP